jgi:hypothetical protein
VAGVLGTSERMIATSRMVLLATTTAAALLVGGTAAADEPADVTAYSCDALTSASVPDVEEMLTAQGLDSSTVDGPVGFACTNTATGQDGVEVSVTGVDGAAYRCASAEENDGTEIVFFVHCAQ